MTGSLTWEREDTDLAVPVQQGAHSEINLDELADLGEKLVQRQARSGPVSDPHRPGLVVLRTDPNGQKPPTGLLFEPVIWFFVSVLILDLPRKRLAFQNRTGNGALEQGRCDVGLIEERDVVVRQLVSARVELKLLHSHPSGPPPRRANATSRQCRLRHCHRPLQLIEELFNLLKQAFPAGTGEQFRRVVQQEVDRMTEGRGHPHLGGLAQIFGSVLRRFFSMARRHGVAGWSRANKVGFEFPSACSLRKAVSVRAIRCYGRTSGMLFFTHCNRLSQGNGGLSCSATLCSHIVTLATVLPQEIDPGLAGHMQPRLPRTPEAKGDAAATIPEIEIPSSVTSLPGMPRPFRPNDTIAEVTFFYPGWRCILCTCPQSPAVFISMLLVPLLKLLELTIRARLLLFFRKLLELCLTEEFFILIEQNTYRIAILIN